MFLDQFIQDVAAAASIAAGQNRPAPATTTSRRRTMTVPRSLPHTVHLCSHCRKRPAGFWVSRDSGQTVRRPWYLSCCQDLNPSRYRVIPFEGHGNAGAIPMNPNDAALTGLTTALAGNTVADPGPCAPPTRFGLVLHAAAGRALGNSGAPREQHS